MFVYLSVIMKLELTDFGFLSLNLQVNDWAQQQQQQQQQQHHKKQQQQHHHQQQQQLASFA